MPRLNKTEVQALLEQAPPTPLISMYVPTHPISTPPNISEDRLRFKNLRNRIIEILRATLEYDIRRIRAIDRLLSQLHEDLNFWETRTYSVAIFVSKRGITTFDLPIDCDEYIAVDSRFHVLPLLGLLSDLIDYYVLVVSKKQPMLFSGNMYGLAPADVQLPVAQSGKRGKHEGQVEPTRTPQAGKGRPEYFGGNFPLVTHDDVLHFFRAADHAVQKYIPRGSPLLLAGPELDISSYRSISTYQYTLNGHIESANSATAQDLGLAASSLIHQEITQKQHQEHIDRFSRLSNGRERAIDGLAAIQDAAEKGRIETLLSKLIRTTTDTVRDNRTAAPKIHFLDEEQMAVVEDVAVLSWRDQGNIVLLDDTSTVPPNSVLGAILRY
jgi:hypothetical protein